MGTIVENVRSQTGESLAMRLERAHKEIESVRLTWEGHPRRFCGWAEERMRAALVAMGTILLCDTPDNLIGSKECVPLVDPLLRVRRKENENVMAKRVNTLTLPGGLCKLADVTSEDRTRYAIDAVHVAVRDHKAHVEAVDGRILCRFTLDAPDCSGVDVLIQRAAWRAGMRTAGENQTVALHFLGDGKVQFKWGGCTFRASPIVGRFPKLEDVIPDYGPSESVSGNLNPDLLGRLLGPISAAIPTVGVETPLELTMPHNTKKPMVISGQDPDGTISVQAVIMPVQIT